MSTPTMYEISAIIPESIQGIIDMIDLYVADGSIGNSGIGEAAKAFLQQVGSDVAREDFGAACARMGHFVEFISGKSDKQIASDAAQVLLGLAQALLGEYGCGL